MLVYYYSICLLPTLNPCLNTLMTVLPLLADPSVLHPIMSAVVIAIGNSAKCSHLGVYFSEDQIPVEGLEGEDQGGH